MNEMIFYRSQSLEFVIIREGILRFEEHSHTSDIVFSGIVKGQAVFSLNSEPHTVSANESFCVLPYENHSLTSDEPVDMLTMCIKKELLQSDSDTLAIIAEAVQGLCMQGELSDNEKNMARALYASASELWDSFIEHEEAEQDILLAEGRKLLEDNPENDSDIQDLAEGCFMSKYHYIRRFRDISGLTPNRFRLQNRVRKAQRMIADGRSISDAALTSGFYDQSHFDRYFKRIVGIPPREYIRSLRNIVQE